MLHILETARATSAIQPASRAEGSSRVGIMLHPPDDGSVRGMQVVGGAAEQMHGRRADGRVGRLVRR
ncbi:hypothetical protein O3I_018315 [Nocardia brasiliensis ATCC 700358]|uniref:Uncharacterized protein n=1 Tax=Nocardia brasiliensis (strain ATCC 700358 / HUJEG-1) TaxID=1133849 RepID=K0EVI2_NOCB7|nr:hypothetical protein O3I_018315 [Nocardia brasiliensis ATCC 700358]